MTPKADNLIWIDLEMTGLDIEKNQIIEMATIVTDYNLSIVAESPVFTIHQPNDILENMDDWNTRQHTSSGLLDRVKNSTTNDAEAENAMLKFLAQYVPAGKSPMCGNSICQDRRFLYRYMPRLEKYFHYRNLDVSTIKELARRWAPELHKGFAKDSAHTALSDVRDSIEEMRYYRQYMGRFAG